MCKSKFDLGEGYKVRVYEEVMGTTSVVVVDIYHPNLGWGSWFLLTESLLFGTTKFIPLSKVTATWVKKQLRKIETGIKTLDNWICDK